MVSVDPGRSMPVCLYQHYNQNGEKKQQHLTYLVPERKPPIFTITALGPNFNPRNIQYIPSVIIWPRLVLEKICRFSVRHYLRMVKKNFHQMMEDFSGRTPDNNILKRIFQLTKPRVSAIQVLFFVYLHQMPKRYMKNPGNL